MVSGPTTERAVPDLGPPLRELRVRLSADVDAPGRARTALQALAPLLDATLLPDLRIVVSELVTNAVRHGPGRPVALELAVHDRRTVRGVVLDDGDAAATPVVVRPAGPEGGWGLRIVDVLCPYWGVRDGSTHVWFVLRRD